jgi:hypothetical protein
MPIWRNSSFNPISTSMSASQRRARSRTPWTISGETRHSVASYPRHLTTSIAYCRPVFAPRCPRTRSSRRDDQVSDCDWRELIIASGKRAASVGYFETHVAGGGTRGDTIPTLIGRDDRMQNGKSTLSAM